MSPDLLLQMARAQIRLNRAADAAATLVRALREDPSLILRIEIQGSLALAHAFSGNLVAARSYLKDFRTYIKDETLPSGLRSEIAYYTATIEVVDEHLGEAEKVLDSEDADKGPIAQGRRLSLRGFIASKKNQFHESTRLNLAAIHAFEAAPVVDIGALANAVRYICVMAREISMPGLLHDAMGAYARIPFTDDIMSDSFYGCRSLGWALALQGPDKYFESLRFLHKAGSLAPSPAWRVWSLLDRAAMKRYAGELASSSADLFEALELCDSVEWASTPEEERTGLLYAAELMAPVDVATASSLLARFGQVQGTISSRREIKGDARLDAVNAYSAGVVYAALGDAERASQLLESAYFVYDRIKYAWRAARTALHLYKLTDNLKWHAAAKRWIYDYPQSWIADELRVAKTGVADEAWNRLTPRQREVFNALCEGLTAKKIADRLQCSPNTVRNHIHWVYNAFRVDSQPELLAEARKRRLI